MSENSEMEHTSKKKIRKQKNPHPEHPLVVLLFAFLGYLIKYYPISIPSREKSEPRISF